MRPILVALVLASGITAASRQRDQYRDFAEVLALDESKDPTANVSIGDVDADGDLDIVLAVGRHDEALDRVLINDGKGRFTSRPLGDRRDPSYSAILGDLDGDRDLDLVVSNDTQPKLIYLNDGMGNFRVAGEWGVAAWATRNATVADLNGDGRPDIVAANRDQRPGSRSHVCLNDGAGEFLTCQELNVGRATTIVAADFDRDGHLDLAAPHRDGGQSVILYNDGKGRFSRSTPFGPNTAAARVAAAGDLNGDGWPDLVLGDERIGSFVLLGDGKGGLLPGLQLKFESLPIAYSMAMTDMNGDGRQDIVIGHAASRGSVMFGDGTGRSFQHVRFGDNTAPMYGLATGDLDRDGYPDVAIARSGAPNLVFFSRRGGSPTTMVASDEIRSPLKGLQPWAPADAKLGIWQGLATAGPAASQWDEEVRLDVLEAGRVAGVVRRASYGVAFCAAEITLTERAADGTMTFTSVGREGCTGEKGTVRARWLKDNSQLEWSYSPEGVPATVTSTLTRRR